MSVDGRGGDDESASEDDDESDDVDDERWTPFIATSDGDGSMSSSSSGTWSSPLDAMGVSWLSSSISSSPPPDPLSFDSLGAAELSGSIILYVLAIRLTGARPVWIVGPLGRASESNDVVNCGLP